MASVTDPIPPDHDFAGALVRFKRTWKDGTIFIEGRGQIVRQWWAGYHRALSLVWDIRIDPAAPLIDNRHPHRTPLQVGPDTPPEERGPGAVGSVWYRCQGHRPEPDFVGTREEVYITRMNGTDLCPLSPGLWVKYTFEDWIADRQAEAGPLEIKRIQ